MSTSYKFADGTVVAVSFGSGSNIVTNMFMTEDEFKDRLQQTVFEFGITNVGSLMSFVQTQEKWGTVKFQHFPVFSD